MDKTITCIALTIVVVVGLFFGLSLKEKAPTGFVGDSMAQASLTHGAGEGAVATAGGALEPEPKAWGAVVKPQALSRSIATAAAVATVPRAAPMSLPELRDLSTASPLVALRLAREGNARDPKGPDAPGRTWVIVKSLTNLQHFDEAREEARRMVSDYPNHPDTLDVERHVLSHP